MQYLTMLTKGRVAEEVDQKEKEGLAYYEYVVHRLTDVLLTLGSHRFLACLQLRSESQNISPRFHAPNASTSNG
jgi:hypothetical protein